MSLSTDEHRSGVELSLSTLLSTTTGDSPAFRAFSSTNFVWLRAPSLASTSSTAPSTIPSTRSTSPPKSACPGVSTTFTVCPLNDSDVYFDEIVMPLSFSRALLSITLSSENAAPFCDRILSTRVVLP